MNFGPYQRRSGLIHLIGYYSTGCAMGVCACVVTHKTGVTRRRRYGPTRRDTTQPAPHAGKSLTAIVALRKST